MKMIDIVDIKQKVKDKEFIFYIKDGCIYLNDVKHDETVIVGKYDKNITTMYADGKKIIRIISNE